MDHKDRKKTTGLKEKDASGKKTSRKFVTIDVKCKQYTMLFPKDFNLPKKRAPSKGRSVRSKSKPVDANSESTTEVNKTRSTSTVQTSSKTGIKLSRKRTEVLGRLNIGNGSSSKTPSDSKREKRKRYGGEDKDIAAENIPLEAFFPAMQYGINKDICPKKRRRLQSLISPQSPCKIFPFV